MPFVFRILKTELLFRWLARIDKPETVLLSFLLCRVLPELRKTLKQAGNFAGLSALPECLDEVVKRGLIGGVDFECFAAFSDGALIISGLQIEFGQYRVGRS